MGLSAAEFVGKILLPLAPHSVVIGADFHFGKGRQGSGEFLKILHGFSNDYRSNNLRKRLNC